MALDLTPWLGAPQAEDTVSTMARQLGGSQILRIASEIRELVAQGRSVCNLTVGDFSPKEFPVPAALVEATAAALRAGETNYPPADGMPALRKAIARYSERTLGLSFPQEGIAVASGARPVIYGAYRAVVDPGDVVVYPVPSWNNEYYVPMVDAKSVLVPTSVEHSFMPTAEQLAPLLPQARMLCLCSPLNPTGTMLSAEALQPIAELVAAENRSRRAQGRKPLILLFDQIYQALTFGRTRHVTPLELVPELAAYTIFVDGISKAFAATGMRVGWVLGPPSIVARMRNILGHVGAWAPRAEQVATARFLEDEAAVASYLESIRRNVAERLEVLHKGFESMRAAGLPVRTIAPQGAIYLSAQFNLVGHGGLRSNEDIRRLLLEKAGFAVVPFQAFGLQEESGWFRLSVGAVSTEELRAALPRVEAALREAVARP
jgi:aspartate aminotransferase